MMQQKMSKKEEPHSTTNIPLPNENILTDLPARSEALKNYQVSSASFAKN